MPFKTFILPELFLSFGYWNEFDGCESEIQKRNMSRIMLEHFFMPTATIKCNTYTLFFYVISKSLLTLLKMLHKLFNALKIKICSSIGNQHKTLLLSGYHWQNKSSSGCPFTLVNIKKRHR